MITSLEATNIDTGLSVFLNDDTYPLKEFIWDQEMKGEAIRKHQRPGRWPTRKQVDFMPIHMEGDMFADTSANYWDIRTDLLTVLLPHPDNVEENHVRFEMVLSGSATTYYADCTLEDYSVPVRALSPTVTHFLFDWANNFGYWRILSSGAVAMI